MKRLHFSFIILTTFFLLNKPGYLPQEKNDFYLPVGSGVEEKLVHPVLVNKFYLMNGNKLFWVTSGNEKKTLRQQLVSVIDTAWNNRLIEKKYHSAELQPDSDINITDSLALLNKDRLYTDAAIALFKDINEGYKMTPWVGYDQLSPKYADSIDQYLLQKLIAVKTAGHLKVSVAMLEPVHKDYLVLKIELKRQMLNMGNKAKDSITYLLTSMNYYRWIHHFRFDQFIVVNLAASRLQYYEKDSLRLDMKTVVGKTSTPTPRFATFCDKVILYPYWYVPASILFNEYLPKIKRNPSWLDAQNMQVVDGTGRVLNHHKLNWASYHSGNFPYILRQSTGCDNALGVIKFNIVSPYGVYLHDTNNKTAFLSAYRFFSHGCMRLEQPLELGNHLLANRLDTTFLQSCFKEQKPIPLLLEKPVPVFVVYMPAVADTSGKVRYYKDVYKLIK